MPDISLEERTLEIYRQEIVDLISTDPKFENISEDSTKAVAKAFDLIMKHGKSKVRAQMLYDNLHKEVNSNNEENA